MDEGHGCDQSASVKNPTNFNKSDIWEVTTDFHDHIYIHTLGGSSISIHKSEVYLLVKRLYQKLAETAHD